MRVVETFFDGSLEKVFAVHLADASADLSDEELKKPAALIREERRRTDSPRLTRDHTDSEVRRSPDYEEFFAIQIVRGQHRCRRPHGILRQRPEGR